VKAGVKPKEWARMKEKPTVRGRWRGKARFEVK
jgi:hypothetical protein